jgi:hypothetical protein
MTRRWSRRELLREREKLEKVTTSPKIFLA